MFVSMLTAKLCVSCFVISWRHRAEYESVFT